MKNFVYAVLGALVLLFSACSKEDAPLTTVVKEGSITVRTAENIQVEIVSISNSEEILTIEFSSESNLIGLLLNSIQELEFTDTNTGESITISITVISYDFFETNLEVQFDKSNIDLSNLELQTQQDLIIEEEEFN